MLTREGRYTKKLVRWESGVRFITFSCQGRLPLLGNAKIRDVFTETLARSREKFSIKLYAWVVMPEHVHLLVQPSKSLELDRYLLWLKVVVARYVIARWREMQAPVLTKIMMDGKPRFWLKGGGFDRTIRHDAEFSETVNYIHRNPVKRGLVESPEHWVWSSATWWMGRTDGCECDPPPKGVVQWGSERAWIELKK